MEKEMITVSKLCSEIVNVDNVQINPSRLETMEDLYTQLYKKFPSLHEDKFNIYWRFSVDYFLKMQDYISYTAALNSMGENKMYMLVNDFEETWRDNGPFLAALDDKEIRDEKEGKRDIYDVKIKRPGDVEIDYDEILDNAYNQEPSEYRTDFNILTYALRKLPEAKCFTADLVPKSNLISYVKKGLPKHKLLLEAPREEIIERPGHSDKKEKGSKKKKGEDKGMKDKKGKKK